MGTSPPILSQRSRLKPQRFQFDWILGHKRLHQDYSKSLNKTRPSQVYFKDHGFH